jgi:methylated-DNA-[protein]-cysteine S-methyltransferase
MDPGSRRDDSVIVNKFSCQARRWSEVRELSYVPSLLYTYPMHPLLTDRIETPIGEMILIARDGVLLLLEFDDSKDRYMREIKARFGDEDLQQASNPFGFSDIVRDYFAGNLHAIDTLKADGGGTAFEQKVWAELRAIPCGVTKSYGEIARKLGDINLSRAVGTANGKNPIAIVVPCHRVIGSDGTMTGYAGGLHRKQWLLRHEGALLL